MLAVFCLISSLFAGALALPSGLDTLESRAAVDNIVYVTDANKFWYATLCLTSQG